MSGARWYGKSLDMAERLSMMITGASGYIGSRLVTRARDAGFRVVAAVRDPARLSVPADVLVRQFDLGRPFDPTLADGVNVIVHLAAIIREDSQPAEAAEDLNVSGTRRLLECARERGVSRFVFVSSQSAAQSSPTKYGRSKWQIEQLLTGEGEIVVHPGMVTGGAPHGVYGALLKLCRRLLIVPVVNGSAPVYPVHIDDLCDGILEIAGSDRPSRGVVRIAPRASVAFAMYLRMLALARLGRPVMPLRVPFAPVLWVNRIAARSGWLPSVSEERLMGLAALKPMREDPRASTQDTASVRDVREVLAGEGRRRRLLLEGRTLFRYCLRGRIASASVRHFVRAVLNENDCSPVSLPWVVHLWPRLLLFFEPVGGSGHARLRRRLVIAMRIVEMTPRAAPVFHNYNGGSRIAAMSRMAGLVVVEVCLLPIRALISRFSTGIDGTAR
jgi:nucleoside-diphosphate-sugar epimerase